MTRCQCEETLHHPRRCNCNRSHTCCNTLLPYLTSPHHTLLPHILAHASIALSPMGRQTTARTRAPIPPSPHQTLLPYLAAHSLIAFPETNGRQATARTFARPNLAPVPCGPHHTSLPIPSEPHNPYHISGAKKRKTGPNIPLSRHRPMKSMNRCHLSNYSVLQDINGYHEVHEPLPSIEIFGPTRHQRVS
jgi:hypothetical protein